MNNQIYYLYLILQARNIQMETCSYVTKATSVLLNICLYLSIYLHEKALAAKRPLYLAFTHRSMPTKMPLSLGLVSSGSSHRRHGFAASSCPLPRFCERFTTIPQSLLIH